MKNNIEFDKDGKFVQLCTQVRERIKKDHGFDPNSVNMILGYATDNERKQLRELFSDELGKLVDDSEDVDVDDLFDTIETDGIAQRNEREVMMNDPTTHLYHAIPHVESYIYNTLHKSKHQCTRKPKPRKKVKHGNRKKK